MESVSQAAAAAAAAERGRRLWPTAARTPGWSGWPMLPGTAHLQLSSPFSTPLTSKSTLPGTARLSPHSRLTSATTIPVRWISVPIRVAQPNRRNHGTRYRMTSNEALAPQQLIGRALTRLSSTRAVFSGKEHKDPDPERSFDSSGFRRGAKCCMDAPRGNDF